MRDNTALIERVREGDKQAENRMVEENMGLDIQYCKTIFKSRI